MHCVCRLLTAWSLTPPKEHSFLSFLHGLLFCAHKSHHTGLATRVIQL